MSDTPKTDAFEALVNRPMDWWDFARELERENAKLQAHAERVGKANDLLAVENAALRKAKEMVELERCEMMRSMSLAQNQSQQLRADKERLDWLETQDCWIGVYGEYDINARICAGGSHSQRIRSAVDAARKEAQP